MINRTAIQQWSEYAPWIDKDSVQSGELMVHWRSRTNNLSF